ncbi:hypothetical protein H6F75_15555 [Nodosilinea sp. FACHB-131]|uniref:hypothetical protein n=1 Tax=Cyanophyceae TaxID=3028117 RepID=UPI0016854022|nr:hypothetical protein [Nodosilinea sp. FACHB-131]MBD1874902.1 hypothetical protein [Nodosilinea sp. FACHB-131]
MLTLFRSHFSAEFYRPLSNFLARLGLSFQTVQMGRLATQTVVVSVLAMALWVGSIGTYTQAAQAGDNLDGRAYEAEHVRQSREPGGRQNVSGSDQPVGTPKGLSQAPEDQAQGVLDNVKDAVQSILPGKSAGDGVGQNAYNPNTNPDTNPNTHANTNPVSSQKR